MKYTVIWRPSAEEELAGIWLDASFIGRARIRTACHTIDSALALGPSHIGKTQSGEIRIVICRPLAVIIEVSEQDRMMIVLKVHMLP